MINQTNRTISEQIKSLREYNSSDLELALEMDRSYSDTLDNFKLTEEDFYFAQHGNFDRIDDLIEDLDQIIVKLEDQVRGHLQGICHILKSDNSSLSGEMSSSDILVQLAAVLSANAFGPSISVDDLLTDPEKIKDALDNLQSSTIKEERKNRILSAYYESYFEVTKYQLNPYKEIKAELLKFKGEEG